jgi:hypothetical protein
MEKVEDENEAQIDVHFYDGSWVIVVVGFGSWVSGGD